MRIIDVIATSGMHENGNAIIMGYMEPQWTLLGNNVRIPSKVLFITHDGGTL